MRPFFRTFANLGAILANLALAYSVQNCAPNPAKPASDPGLSPASPAIQNEAPIAPKSHSMGSDLDRLLDAKPLPIPEIKTPNGAISASPSPASPSVTKGGSWRIQAGALADLESAQNRKKELEQKLGGTVDMSFDPPYYKLKWGAFATRQEADDKLLELSDIIHDGFIIRQ